MKRVLDPTKTLDASQVDPLLAAKCAKTYVKLDERQICERIGMAGLSAANFFHMIEKKPRSGRCFQTRLLAEP